MKSSRALADIQNLLAGTCPPPVGDEVTAANADSRSNAFAAAEGAPRPLHLQRTAQLTRRSLAQITRSAPPRSCTTRRCRSLSRRRCSARAEATSPRRAPSLCAPAPRRAARPRTNASSRSRPAWTTYGGDRLTSRWRRSPSCSTASTPHDCTDTRHLRAEVAPSPLAVAGAPSTTSTCATGSSSWTATPAGTPSTGSTCACSARGHTTLCS